MLQWKGEGLLTTENGNPLSASARSASRGAHASALMQGSGLTPRHAQARRGLASGIDPSFSNSLRDYESRPTRHL